MQVGANAARVALPQKNFDAHLPPVPVHAFVRELEEARAKGGASRLIPLDLSAPLRLGFPATTPNMLARYVVLTVGDPLSHTCHCAGVIFYAMHGSGCSESGGATIRWKQGDVFCLPGGGPMRHNTDDCALLLCVTNEPMLTHLAVCAMLGPWNPVALAHFDGKDIAAQLRQVTQVAAADSTKAILLYVEGLADTRCLVPGVRVAMNSLEAAQSQPPHRHNATAITLALASDNVYSLVDDERVDWAEDLVFVTPPAATHSHHNNGKQMMQALVFQDGGLFWHSRVMGFHYG